MAVAPELPVAIELVAVGSWVEKVDAVSLVLSPDRGSGTVDAIRVRHPASGTVRVPLAEDRVWTVRVEDGGLWSPAVRIERARPARVELPIFQAGKVVGQITAVRDLRPGPEVEARFESVPRPATDPRISVGRHRTSCPIDEAGRFECTLPADELDLRLHLRGSAPWYRWGARVDAQRPVRLGAMELEPGASISGFVEASGGESLPAGCRVVASPPALGRADPTTRSRLERMSLEAPVNDRGFFQILAAPPGQYALAALCEGFAPSPPLKASARAGLEAQLVAPLEVVRPGQLTVTIDPPVTPWGSLWTLELHRRSRSADRDVLVQRAQVDGTGWWATENLAVGDYRVVLSEASPVDGAPTRWLVTRMAVTPGDNVAGLEVPLLAVEGEVRRGRQPVSGRLWLHRGGDSISFDLDSHGGFEGYLTAEGRWSVTLDSRDGQGDLAAVPVDVVLEEGEDVAHVEIELPNTIVRGEVLDPDGRPQPDALVVVRVRAEDFPPFSSKARTDENGRFEYLGLPEAEVSVQARVLDQESAWVDLVIESETVAPFLQLVLEERKELRGRIRHRGDSVAGAQLFFIAGVVGGASMGVVDNVIAGVDGRFSLSVPGNATEIALAVMAPGYALQLVRVPVDSAAGEIEIRLERDGGELRAAISEFSPRSSALVAESGAALPVAVLAKWQRHHGAGGGGERLVIPNLAPGLYKLCPSIGSLASGDGCRQGYLPPNSLLELGE